MTIGDRIESIMKYKQLNYSSFGVKVGYSDTQIKNIITNKSVPKFDLIQTLLRVFPELNPNWLTTGEGVMIKKEKNLQVGSDQIIQDQVIENVYDILDEIINEPDLNKRKSLQNKVYKYIQNLELEHTKTLKELNSLRKDMMRHFNL